MRLPNLEGAIVDLAKLRDYLLSPTHPVGRSKARFFSNLGFGPSHVASLEAALRTIAGTNEISEVVSSRYGQKFVIDGLIETPSGAEVGLRTIWILETGQEAPPLLQRIRFR